MQISENRIQVLQVVVQIWIEIHTKLLGLINAMPQVCFNKYEHIQIGTENIFFLELMISHTIIR